MYKIKILALNKTKERWLDSALYEYEKRLSSSLKFHWIFETNEKKWIQSIQKEKSYFCLDPKGISLTTEELYKKLLFYFQIHKCHLTFVIGGPTGIPQGIQEKAKDIWSLSPLTFSHQITRLIFVEQIYRALEIEKGSNYHK